MDLGEFGAAMREADPSAPKDTFRFFGEEYRVVGAIPAMLALQLGAASSGKLDEAEGLVAIWEALRLCLDEPDRETAPGEPAPVKQFSRFYKAAVDSRCDLEPLMRLAFALFEAQDGRPTDAAPASPGGPPRTSPSSSASLSAAPASPLSSPQEQPARPGEHKALAHLVPVSNLLTG